MKVRLGPPARYFGLAHVFEGLERPSIACCEHRQNHQSSSFVLLKNQRDCLKRQRILFSAILTTIPNQKFSSFFLSTVLDSVITLEQ
jgi:hypothetical protein